MSSVVLAFDAALSTCSACIARDGAALAHRFEHLERGQSEALVPMIATVLESAGATISDIDLIATTVGPGTFTGLRIGLATARGLGLATGKPVVGLTTLETVAFAQDCPQPFLVALETKRSDYYVQMFQGPGDALAEPAALEAEAVLAALGEVEPALVGDAADRLAAALEKKGRVLSKLSGPMLPDARCVAALATTRQNEPGAISPARAPAPLYLRAPDVSMPKTG